MFLAPLRLVFFDDLDLTAFPWADPLPRRPDWMRGHLTWERSFARRFWPVPAKRLRTTR